MRRLAVVLVIAMASLCLASPSSAGVCERTITIEDFSYSPASMTKVARAEVFVVCWHNSDGVNHTATSNTGIFDTGIITSDGEVAV